MFRSLLVVGGVSPPLVRALPLLQRADLEVRRIPDAREGAEVVESTQFDLIITQFPLEGLPLGELVEAVRSTSSLSRNAGLLVLTDNAHLGRARVYLGHGVNRVISLDNPDDSIVLAVADLIAISPRKTVRLMVQLELEVKAGPAKVLSLTQNISTAGMLVKGGQHELPVGSRIQFELSLPDGGSPILGEAEVVRHAMANTESFDGVGVRFISLQADALRRLEAFIARGLRNGT
jgi:CheY-like chemotaxis protein